MNRRIIPIALTLSAALVLLSGPARTRTWYVNISGTGDAPTIEAALDSAVSGDTVLVGPGEYLTDEGSYTVGPGVVVMSEMGPLQTRVRGFAGSLGSLPFGMFDLLPGSELSGFWVDGALVVSVVVRDYCKVTGNILGGPGSAVDIQYSPAMISNNLFLEDGGVLVEPGGGGVYFDNNIVYCEIICNGQPPSAACNDFLGPDTPCLQALFQLYWFANFSADPQFCGVEGSDDYYLQSDSPCAPGNAPTTMYDCEGTIGPLPVGCGPVSTEVKSWGAIKSMYRE